MAVITSCKYLLCVQLWVACLVNCVSLTQGQVDCSGDDVDQCEVGYYCDGDYRCKKCAPCEYFQPASPCAKSLLDCGACLDGYEFLSIGKCAVRAYDGNVGTILLLVVTGCSTAILLIVIITAALRYIRKKRTKTYSCSNRFSSEVGVVRNVAAAPTAPEYPPPPPPPYTSHNPQPAFNSLYNASSEPLLKSQISAPECQVEEHQMARPYSQYVCLPPGLRSFDGEHESFNENVGVEENFNNENITNNNEAPTTERPSVRQRMSGALLPALPADHATDSLSLRDLTISTQAQESDIVSCTESVGGLSAPQCERSRPPSPGHARDEDTAGAQQVIVQFISNVSPILNLQGNNTRR